MENKDKPTQLNKMAHPGEAFERAYLPTQGPRTVVETHKLLRSKIAGEIGFSPVTKMNLPDRSVYVRPVKNTHQRPVSPLALTPEGNISIKGEQQIALTPNLHSEIKTKAESVFNQENKPSLQPNASYINTTNVAHPQPIPATQTPSDESNRTYNEHIKNQLDQINKMLFEQIKQKVSEELSRQNQPQAQGNTSSPALPFSKPVPITTPAQMEPQSPQAPVKPREKLAPLVPSKADYDKHVAQLEKEITHLQKEIGDLDRAFEIAKTNSQSAKVAQLEKEIEMDTSILQAAQEWRETLTKLINSHSVALKYLKERTDRLEETLKTKPHPHAEKHSAHHKKEKEHSFAFDKLKDDVPVIKEIVREVSPQIHVIKEVPAPMPTQPKAETTQVVLKPAGETKQPFEDVRDLARPADAERELVAPPVPAPKIEVKPEPKAQEPVVVPEAPKLEILTPIATPSNTSITAPVNTKPSADPNEPEVSLDALRAAFSDLKTALTTIDSENLKNLSSAQRQDLLRKVNDLENQEEVAKQFDEIKSREERRRINQEVQRIFTQVNTKPTNAVATNTNEQPNKVEELKEATRKALTPAEKAKIIVEIKELERKAQKAKEKEVKPEVVKAQPAYGKMLPNTPTIPNVVNGIIKDANGLLLSGVVIIVKDKSGASVRALRPNKLGQFALSTPVPDGTYTLELEKEGYNFDIIEVTAEGSIMKPIEIRAKNLVK